MKDHQTEHPTAGSTERSYFASGEEQLLLAVCLDQNEEPVCTCDHLAPHKRRLGSPKFLKELATFYASLELPASQALNFIWDELYGYSSGTLHDPDDRPIDLFEEFQRIDKVTKEVYTIDFVDWAFGDDMERSTRRFLERAETTYHNQLKMTPQMIARVLLLHYAREVHLCRTQGKCSQK